MRKAILLFVVSQMSLCASLMIHKSFHSQHYKKSLTRMRATVEAEYALLFDCDGVIVETEVRSAICFARIIYLSVHNSFSKNDDGEVINVEDKSTIQI